MPLRPEPGEADHFTVCRESFIAPRGVPGVNCEVAVPGDSMSPALAKAVTAAVCRSSFHTTLESIRNTLPPPFAAGGPGKTDRALAAVPSFPTVAQSSGARRRHDSPGRRADETQMHFGVDSKSQGRPDRACRAAHRAATTANAHEDPRKFPVRAGSTVLRHAAQRAVHREAAAPGTASKSRCKGRRPSRRA